MWDFIQQRRLRKHHDQNGDTYHLDNLVLTLPGTVAASTRDAVIRGTYEKHLLHVIRSHIGRDKPVIHLGGGYGIVTQYIARLTDSGTNIVVVEPNPGLLDLCRKNAIVPDRYGVTTVIDKAIAYGAMAVPFDISGPPNAWHVAADVSGNTIDVRTVTLNHLVRRHVGDDQPYNLIMDINGAENDVLKHDAVALANCQVAIIRPGPDAAASARQFARNAGKTLKSAGMTLKSRRDNLCVFTRPS